MTYIATYLNGITGTELQQVRASMNLVQKQVMPQDFQVSAGLALPLGGGVQDDFVTLLTASD